MHVQQFIFNILEDVTEEIKYNFIINKNTVLTAGKKVVNIFRFVILTAVDCEDYRFMGCHPMLFVYLPDYKVSHLRRP